MSSTLTPPLTAAPPETGDRCDRCSAAAKLRIMIAGDGELMFCGHHANRYAEDLAKITIRYAEAPDFQWRGADLVG
jgi:hypothetical protein